MKFLRSPAAHFRRGSPEPQTFETGSPHSRRWLWLAQTAQDFRYGARQLIKAPGFATIAILTVALGIAACTSLFSVVNCTLLHPVVYENPDRLVELTGSWLPKFPHLLMSPGTYRVVATQATVFENLAANMWESHRLIRGTRDVVVFTDRISSDYFRTFRLHASLGRGFLPEDYTPDHGRVLILSQALWQKEFGGSEQVLGEKVQLDDRIYTVVGVVLDPQWPQSLACLAPITDLGQASDFEHISYWAVGRLKPGVALKTARAEMDVIAKRLALEHPATNRDRGLALDRQVDLMTEDYREQLLLLLGAVLFLLLIACVNVASLLLARANARQREFALRLALGAGRGRLIRQLLCESVLISAVGGVLGILGSAAAMGPLAAFARHSMPQTERFALDGTVLAATCGLMLLAGLGCGLLPALQATRGEVVDPLKDGGNQNSSGGRRGRRVQSGLVVIEIALALVLLTCSGLLIRSLHSLQQVDQGLKTDHVFTTNFSINSRHKYPTPEKLLAFMNTSLERLHGLPVLQKVAFTSSVPMGNNQNYVPQSAFRLEGRPAPANPTDELLTDYYAVTPEYFSVMSVPLLSGRNFNDHDAYGSARVVLINREMARKHFPHQDPIGRKIRFLRRPGEAEQWDEIIGIVGDVKPRGPQSPTDPQVYEPLEQVPQSEVTIVMRGTDTEQTTGPLVRDILRSIDKDNPIEAVYGYDSTIAHAWARQKFNMTLFSLFSGMALLLAAVGIYGVMAYSVSQRTHEIGIRMALGALPRDVLRLVLGDGARIVGLGLLCGTAASLATTRLLSALLFNTSPYDPITFTAIFVVLAAAALIACWIPARRATRVDPLVALRHD